MISYPIFGGNFGISLLLSNLSSKSVIEIQRTPEGPEFRMPESRQHREEGGKIKWLGRSQIFGWGEGLGVFWPKFFGNFRNLGVFFVFFSRCFFFVLECSGVVCWGDVNNFGRDVYFNCLRDWFTSHDTGPGSLTVTCYMTAFSMENVRWWIIINLPTFLSYFLVPRRQFHQERYDTPLTPSLLWKESLCSLFVEV